MKAAIFKDGKGYYQGKFKEPVLISKKKNPFPDYPSLPSKKTKTANTGPNIELFSLDFQYLSLKPSTKWKKYDFLRTVTKKYIPKKYIPDNGLKQPG